jgi:autotransporter-associated beta strand protein
LTVGTGNITGSSGGSFTIGGAGNTTVNSVIDLGTGGVTKTGGGTATLVGTNLYSGATTVSSGTLLINGNQSAATGTVSVGSGATLGGIGTIGGAITVSSGGTLQADNGVTPGNLRVADVTIASGATLAAVIGENDTNSEFVFGASSLELTTGSVLKLSSISGFDRTQSANYTLADFTGGSIELDATPRSDGFTFGSYTHGSGATGAVVIDPALVAGLVAGDSFSLTMTNGDLMLSFTPVPVPEPAAVLGIAVAALGVGGFVRRRFRKSPEPASAA